MLDVLLQVEKALPRLLNDESALAELVRRLPSTDCRAIVDGRAWVIRIYLHRIYPCVASRPSETPTRGSSAMRVLDGEYEMAVGFGAGNERPPVAALMIARGDFRYEMTHSDSWHYVCRSAVRRYH